VIRARRQYRPAPGDRGAQPRCPGYPQRQKPNKDFDNPRIRLYIQINRVRSKSRPGKWFWSIALRIRHSEPRRYRTYRDPVIGAHRYGGRRRYSATAVREYSQFRVEPEETRQQSARPQDRLRGRERNFRRLHIHPSIGPPWRSQVSNLRVRRGAGNRARLHAPRRAVLDHLGAARAAG
jgi:hypothetical protein